jgi:hypothetical protein
MQSPYLLWIFSRSATQHFLLVLSNESLSKVFLVCLVISMIRIFLMTCRSLFRLMLGFWCLLRGRWFVALLSWWIITLGSYWRCRFLLLLFFRNLSLFFRNLMFKILPLGYAFGLGCSCLGIAFGEA